MTARRHMSAMGTYAGDTSVHALAVAVEANTVAWLTYVARLPGGELHDEPDATWYVTGRSSPLLNGVARATLRAESPDELEARIGALLGRFRERRLPLCWWTGPSTAPADLGARLESRGLRRAADASGMAATLRTVPQAPAPPGLTVVRVADTVTLESWLDAGQRSRTPEPVRTISAEANAALALDPDGPLRHYVGFLEGRPVAKATLFLGARAAGIYNVLVHPDLRRRRIGTAMTAAPLRDATALGYTVAVLAASAMAVGMYRRLGFREYTRIGMYVADPVDSPGRR